MDKWDVRIRGARDAQHIGRSIYACHMAAQIPQLGTERTIAAAEINHTLSLRFVDELQEILAIVMYKLKVMAVFFRIPLYVHDSYNE